MTCVVIFVFFYLSSFLFALSGLEVCFAVYIDVLNISCAYFVDLYRFKYSCLGALLGNIGSER